MLKARAPDLGRGIIKKNAEEMEVSTG